MEPTSPTLVCYHGSPGLPEEFRALRTLLAPHPVEAPPRAGYPGAGPGAGTGPSGAVLLGYSWGALAALRDAVSATSSALSASVAESRKRVHGVILVAPYVVPPKRLGLATKLLLRTPVLGEAILRKAGRRIVDEMFEKSCSPQAIPTELWKLSERMASPAMLRRAALEKEEPGLSASECLRLLAERRVPVGLVVGTDDRSAPESVQAAPLRALTTFIVDERIAGGGHALNWTHPAELAAAVKNFLSRINELP